MTAASSESFARINSSDNTAVNAVCGMCLKATIKGGCAGGVNSCNGAANDSIAG